MYILDIFWLVRFKKVRVETEIEPFWRLDPLQLFVAAKA